MRRLTFGQKNRFPIWSGDGQHIAFQSDREGDLGIFWQRADGTGTTERLTKPEQGTSHIPESWSPDGKRFLFAATKGSSTSLWAFLLEDKKATPFGDVQSRNPINSVFSPDGRWVAYYSNETGSDAIYVQPFPVTGVKYQIPKNDPSQNDHHPVWSSDGKELFYIPAPGALAAISVTTRPDFSFGNPVPVPRKFTSAGNSARLICGITTSLRTEKSSGSWTPPNRRRPETPSLQNFASSSTGGSNCPFAVSREHPLPLASHSYNPQQIGLQSGMRFAVSEVIANWRKGHEAV